MEKGVIFNAAAKTFLFIFLFFASIRKFFIVYVVNEKEISVCRFVLDFNSTQKLRMLSLDFIYYWHKFTTMNCFWVSDDKFFF